jgi:hypothetical protein
MTLREKRGPYKKPKSSPVGYTIKYVVNKAGGAKVLSEMLGITKQAVYRWKAVPVDHAELVSRLSGLPLAIVRPDLVEGAS